MQCELTQIWRTVNGKICPIMSDRNRPNPYGIKHQFGKNAGQLKKNKLLTTQEVEEALAEATV